MEEETIKTVVYIAVSLVGLAIAIILYILFGGGTQTVGEQIAGIIPSGG